MPRPGRPQKWIDERNALLGIPGSMRKYCQECTATPLNRVEGGELKDT